MADYLPRADAAFLLWSRQFQLKVAAAPEQYGFTPERAAELTAAWELFDETYQTMHTPDTRTSPAAAAKRAARAALERLIRQMAQMVRTRVSQAGALVELGLRPTVRTRTRIARPAVPPMLRLIDFDGSTVRLKLLDASSPTRRGKPRGTSGAIIFFRLGDDDSRPMQVRLTSRSRYDLALRRMIPSLAPGTRVRIGASWMNPRGQEGPMSSVLEVRVGYPMLMLAA